MSKSKHSAEWRTDIIKKYLSGEVGYTCAKKWGALRSEISLGRRVNLAEKALVNKGRSAIIFTL